LEKDDFLKRELLIDLKKIDEEAKQRKVYAAYDGVLSGLKVQLGQRLTAQTQIAELMDDSKLELDLWIPEQQVAVIKLGMSANVILASSNASAMAKVIRLPNLIDESNGSGMITVSISPRPRDWQVGAFARVVFTLDKVGPNMLVPKRCVKYERNRPFVWIAHPEDDRLMAKKVWVSTGDSDDEFMIIKKGLKEEDQVIIEGLRQLSEGLSLEILPQAEEQ
jgi:membrane fusion protein (multidrug efflux system)